MAGHFIRQTGSSCLIQNIYYFAFGSNLNHYRLHQRIGDYQTFGIGYLDNHKLVFNKRGGDDSGKCTVTASISDKVWGVVCQLNLEQKQKLDYFEGVGHGYDAIIKNIITLEKTIETVLYQAQLDATDDGLSPFDWYKDFVLTGANSHRLPAQHIEMIENVASIKDPDLKRVHTNKMIIQGNY